MNRIQRFLLMFSAVLILVFSDSSYGDGSYLKLFISAVLLFFGFSPVRWFCKKQTLPMQPVEQKNEETEDEEARPLPVLGFPTPEQLLVVRSLIKLRAAEIGGIYRTLRDYQRQAKDDNWVPLFMKRKAVSDLYDGPYVQVEKEDMHRAEVEAEELFQKRYKFCSIAPIDLYDEQIADLQVALASRSASPVMIVSRLEEIKSFGVLRDWIDTLVKLYRILDLATGGGDFNAVFKREKKSSSFKPLLDQISAQWSDLYRLLKMSILLSRIHGNIPNEEASKKDVDLEEIEALSELEISLDWVIAQENMKRKGISSMPFEEKEPFFFERLKFNPFWHKFF